MASRTRPTPPDGSGGPSPWALRIGGAGFGLAGVEVAGAESTVGGGSGAVSAAPIGSRRSGAAIVAPTLDFSRAASMRGSATTLRAVGDAAPSSGLDAILHA